MNELKPALYLQTVVLSHDHTMAPQTVMSMKINEKHLEKEH